MSDIPNEIKEELGKALIGALKGNNDRAEWDTVTMEVITDRKSERVDKLTFENVLKFGEDDSFVRVTTQLDEDKRNFKTKMFPLEDVLYMEAVSQFEFKTQES